ncbi:oligosaccharide flippase family protein [Sphingomonas azotifigens]|uniref:oligosaccharide flippase family protein n=1 Tax=Sphingomonas azotifigens TaxID=330920 RepID=UPI0009FD1B4C|nr:oligosaccharide flippase family protein [Sphingomonas azotifigens]
MARIGAIARDKGLKDVFYLMLTQVATLLVPLMTFPWAVRALHPPAYGRYSFGVAVVQYLLIIVDFGFQFAASRRVVELQTQGKDISAYYWTVQVAKFGLFVATTASIGIFWLLSPDIRQAMGVILASLPLLLASILQSTWLFLGVGAMAASSIAVLVARLAFVIPVFLLVRAPGDEWILALLNSGGALLGGLICTGIVLRRKLVTRFVLPSFRAVRAAYGDGFHLFIAQGAVSLYAASNAIVLGFVSTDTQVAYFAAADRLRGLSSMPIVAVTNAYFGRIAKGLRTDPPGTGPLLRNVTWLLVFGMGFVSIVTFVAADLIVYIVLGARFGAAAAVLRVLSPIPFIVGLNSVFGNLVMLNLGLKRQFSAMLVACGALNVVLLAVLGHQLGAVGAAAALLFTEALVTAAFWYQLHKRGISVFRGRLDGVEPVAAN